MNTPALNYNVYYMKKSEKVLWLAVIFVVGAAIAYLMYGGLAKDNEGNATVATHILNVIICGSIGISACVIFLPIVKNTLLVKRRNLLRCQFMDMLDSLSSSISAGNNAVKAFEAAHHDLIMQHGEDSYIVNEVALIVSGQKNYIDIDNLMADFGKRAGIQEIENFAQVFSLSYRKGGDFSKVIRDSYEILYNKMNIEMEIETKLSSNKSEMNIMLVMPVLLMVMMKSSGGDFANNFSTPSGILGITIGLAVVIGAYILGRKITNIEV